MFCKRGGRAAFFPLVLFWGATGPLVADDLDKQAEILQTVDQVTKQGPFRADFASISQTQVPDWYRDAKFGIFLHWGVYSVPAWDTEWYPYYMYQQGSDEYNHQINTYGPLTSSGYKDFIPQLTGSAFDADAWVTLFKQCGAKFVVPVSEHHDGFSMWNNPLNSYNSENMGPHQDIVGALAAATRKQGLAFGLSNHRSEHWYFFQYGMQDPGSDVQNPAYADLYGPAQSGSVGRDAAFLDNWLARATASIDAYQPDLVYFDAGLGGAFYQPYLPKLGAHFYNRAAQWTQEPVLTVKDGYPGHAAISDVELGTSAGISPAVWQADTSVAYGSWGYISNNVYKDPGLLIRELVDDVSKNGILLLNLGPKPDGTIPVEQQQVLQGVGDWLAVNGEAIYGTRPWSIYGEGANQFTAGAFGDSATPVFTGTDIRFTRKGDVLYAVLMAWPGSQATITSLASTQPVPVSGAITGVQLLGQDDELVWSQTAEGLIVNMPANPPKQGGHAYVLKISGLRLPGIAPDPNGILRLGCGQAVFQQEGGQRFRYGLTDACYFNSRNETASWRAHFNAPGDYAVTVYGSAAAGDSAFQLIGPGGPLTDVVMVRTDEWDHFVTSTPSYIHVGAAGDYDLTVKPYGPMSLVHLDLRAVVLPKADGSLQLTPSGANINGSRLQVETTWGPEDLGFWNDGRESVSWLVHFPAKGSYTLTAGFSTTVDHAAATIEVGGQPVLASFPMDVTNTGGWDKALPFRAGSVAVEQAGDYVVSVRATDTTNWHPVDIYYMRFTQ